MPRYNNANAVDTFVGFLRIPANSYIDTESVFATLPSGVTKTAVAPNCNPVIYSTSITGGSGSTTYAIPDVNMNYTIRIWCKAGAASVAFNDSAELPVLTMIAGESAGFRVINRTIGAVIITLTAGSTTVKLDVCHDASIGWDVA